MRAEVGLAIERHLMGHNVARDRVEDISSEVARLSREHELRPAWRWSTSTASRPSAAARWCRSRWRASSNSSGRNEPASRGVDSGERSYGACGTVGVDEVCGVALGDGEPVDVLAIA